MRTLLLCSELGNLSQIFHPEFRTLLHLEAGHLGAGYLEIPLPLHMAR
jgi:hypothetical protein